MLHKIMRHGFEFWEAPRNTGAVFEYLDPNYLQRRERAPLRRMKLEELVKIVALAISGFNNSIVEQEESEASELNARAKGGKGPYRKKKENPNDAEIWGELVQFSDEEPTEVLNQLGIPVEAKPHTMEPDMAEIQDRSMEVFGVTKQQFFEQNRRSEVALCRFVSMALCRAHTSRTTAEIGEAHGRDHARVCRAVKRVAKLREENGDMAHKVAMIEAKLIRQVAEAA